MDQSVTVRFCMTANVPTNHRYTLHWKCLIVIPSWDETLTHICGLGYVGLILGLVSLKS